MGAIAVVQIVLFALGAAKVGALTMFANTEFLLPTIINAAQTVVAFQINAATLMRTITSNPTAAVPNPMSASQERLMNGASGSSFQY